MSAHGGQYLLVKMTFLSSNNGHGIGADGLFMCISKGRLRNSFKEVVVPGPSDPKLAHLLFMELQRPPGCHDAYQPSYVTPSATFTFCFTYSSYSIFLLCVWQTYQGKDTARSLTQILIIIQVSYLRNMCYQLLRGSRKQFKTSCCQKSFLIHKRINIINIYNTLILYIENILLSHYPFFPF